MGAEVVEARRPEGGDEVRVGEPDPEVVREGADPPLALHPGQLEGLVDGAGRLLGQPALCVDAGHHLDAHLGLTAGVADGDHRRAVVDEDVVGRDPLAGETFDQEEPGNVLLVGEAHVGPEEAPDDVRGRGVRLGRVQQPLDLRRVGMAQGAIHP